LPFVQLLSDFGNVAARMIQIRAATFKSEFEKIGNAASPRGVSFLEGALHEILPLSIFGDSHNSGNYLLRGY
jgi:hypothetical protein